jgi:hypothetical protein
MANEAPHKTIPTNTFASEWDIDFMFRSFGGKKGNATNGSGLQRSCGLCTDIPYSK